MHTSVLLVALLFTTTTFALNAHFRVVLNPTDTPCGRVEYYNGSGLQVIGDVTNEDACNTFTFNLASNTTSYGTRTGYYYDAEYEEYQAVTDNEMFALVDESKLTVAYYMRPNVYGLCPAFLIDSFDNRNTNTSGERRVVGTLDENGWCVITHLIDPTVTEDRDVYFKATEAAWNDFAWLFYTTTYNSDVVTIVLHDWTTSTTPNAGYKSIAVSAQEHLISLIPAEECSPTCLNGGVCKNGTCLCVGGYTNADCNSTITATIIQNVQQFTGITPGGCDKECQNGGLCQNGVCFCPGGYVDDVCNVTLADFLQTIDFSSATSTSTTLLCVVGLVLHLAR